MTRPRHHDGETAQTPMELIDSHCHLDSPRIAESDRPRMLDAAATAGVTDIVIPGVSPETWVSIQHLVRDHAAHTEQTSLPRLHPCAGIHPQVLPGLNDTAVAEALDRLDTFSRDDLVAIGETGLDRPTTKVPGGELSRQQEVLDAHLDVAARKGLPVVLHCFRCHDALLASLRRRGGHPPGVILHSFSGSPETIAQYLELDAWISFAGPVTYPNARRPVAALRATPIERLLIETDAPDQTPAPYRGQRNEPAFLLAIAERVADLLEMPVADIADWTTRNARTCYGLQARSPRRAAGNACGARQEDQR